MMKKIFAIFAIMLALALPLAGCDKKEVEEQGGGTQTGKEPYTVTLADFETFDDIYNVYNVVSNKQMLGWFTQGPADKAISGSHSLQVCCQGSSSGTYGRYIKDSGGAAYLYYAIFSNTKNDGNWGFDWKNVSKTSVEVFNDNDFDIQASMFFFTSNYFPYNYGTITVPAGATVTLESKANRYFMQHELTRGLSYVAFTFDYDKKVQEDGTLYMPEAMIYLDNLRVEIDERSVYNEDGSLIVEKEFADENEILLFNDPSDLDYMRETAQNYVKEADNEWGTYTWFCGTGSAIYFNDNPKYIHEGNTGSLEWRVNPIYNEAWGQSNYQYQSDQNFAINNNGMTGITVCAEFLDWYNFSKIIRGEAKITVDVYNAGEFDKEVAFGMHDYNAVAQEVKYEWPYRYGMRAMVDKWTKLPAGEWTTLEITDFSHIDFGAGLARLRLTTSTMDTFQPTSFYVNNLRLVEI